MTYGETKYEVFMHTRLARLTRPLSCPQVRVTPPVHHSPCRCHLHTRCSRHNLARQHRPLQRRSKIAAVLKCAHLCVVRLGMKVLVLRAQEPRQLVVVRAHRRRSWHRRQ